MPNIETSGSTRLDYDGSNRYTLGAGATILTYGGVAVTTTSFSGWAAIGAELINGVYQVVWKSTANQYVIWLVASNGAFQSMGNVLNGTSADLRALEPGFAQDLNGTSGIEAVSSTVEASGSTTTLSVAGAYVLAATGTSRGPVLRSGGSAVLTGQFGAGWTIRGAEFNGSIYEVLWQNGGTPQWVVWNVDSNGNFLSQSAALNSTQVAAYEPGFSQDINGGGVAARAVIEASGSTTLATVASTYYTLSPTASSLGQVLKYGGAQVTVGQFAGWSPIAAELSGGQYRMVWKNGSSVVAWNVDGDGNFLSQGAIVGASTYFAEAYETTVQFDVNGDGTVGATTAAIEGSGNTTLTQVADSYFFNYGTGSQIQLRYGASYAQVGQFSTWVPLAVEFSGGMYRMAWKNGGNDLYVAWNVDSSGNFISQGAGVTGSTWYVQSYETTVGRDLNSDGIVGPTTAAIEGSGNTTLTRVADSWFFNYGSSNIQLRYGGGYAAVGQFGGWAPLAVEFSAGMYRMAWKNGGNDQYLAWNVDSGGNFASQGPVVAGSTWYLQSYESVVGRDLNSDGQVGPIVSAIENTGNTTLTKAADSYFINWGGSNIQVLYGGAYAGSNQFPNWSAVGAEQTVGSYMVAWRNSASGNYTVWNLDGSGNYLWNSSEYGVGSAPFQAIETAFGQDFNGGGVSGKTAIEGSGSTALYSASGYLQMVRGPYTGPLLAYGANYVTASQFGTALGAEWTGNGYTVAWKVANDTYNFWTTDATGRYASQTGSLSGSSAQMQAYEPTFNQDLNGDGVIGVNNSPFNIQIVFSGASQYQTYFEQAAHRWESIIRADLPAVNSSTYGLIDDLRIDASVAAIDGTNGILAQAGWDLRRSTSDGGLPYHGVMKFDSADINTMVNNGTFLYVVMHEMGHVLGLGTLWDTFGLRGGSSYTGTNANNAYHQLGGSGFVPLETTGGSGTAFVHWSEAAFDRELMTGFSETAPPMPLSIVTIGGLQDLGYTVDYSRADAYGLPGHLTAGLGSDVVDDSGAASQSGILSEFSPLAGGSGTLAVNDAVAGLPVVDDRGLASQEGILTDFVDGDMTGGSATLASAGGIPVTEDANINGGAGLVNMSLLTSYIASSFVTSPGEGAGTVVSQSAQEDTLTRPAA
ncbi:Leishmanolysin [Rhodospirillales bacterium URHD0017]|nr:Leishmanolysin [Rhodospirillales bacterium URHD0017]